MIEKSSSGFSIIEMKTAVFYKLVVSDFSLVC